MLAPELFLTGNIRSSRRQGQKKMIILKAQNRYLNTLFEVYVDFIQPQGNANVS